MAINDHLGNLPTEQVHAEWQEWQSRIAYYHYKKQKVLSQWTKRALNAEAS